jgi:hypothetical protein
VAGKSANGRRGPLIPINARRPETEQRELIGDMTLTRLGLSGSA